MPTELVEATPSASAVQHPHRADPLDARELTEVRLLLTSNRKDLSEAARDLAQRMSAADQALDRFRGVMRRDFGIDSALDTWSDLLEEIGIPGVTGTENRLINMLRERVSAMPTLPTGEAQECVALAMAIVTNLGCALHHMPEEQAAA